MNWKPLDHKTIDCISTLINYDKEKIRGGDLYSKIADINYSLDCKVKFILKHWGWRTNTNNQIGSIISHIKETGFTIPENVQLFYNEMYGLRIPIKNIHNPYDRNGGTFVFSFMDEWEDEISGSEFLSIKYNDNIMPIGYALNYNGWSDQQADGWEDPNFICLEKWSYGLYLGESGKIYFGFMGDSDDIGIMADNLETFFADSFGLNSYKKQYCEELDMDDFDFMDKIDQLYAQGEYTQNQFKK